MDRIDLFADSTDVANQLHYQISLPTPKITTIILPTLTNYSYPILPTPLPSNALAGILSVYISATEKGEILGQNTENIENTILSQNTSDTLKSYILENDILVILLLLLILY